jgi:hypothetical protein
MIVWFNRLYASKGDLSNHSTLESMHIESKHYNKANKTDPMAIHPYDTFGFTSFPHMPQKQQCVFLNIYYQQST